MVFQLVRVYLPDGRGRRSIGLRGGFGEWQFRAEGTFEALDVG
jgi:hypothetical protein